MDTNSDDNEQSNAIKSHSETSQGSKGIDIVKAMEILSNRRSNNNNPNNYNAAAMEVMRNMGQCIDLNQTSKKEQEKIDATNELEEAVITQKQKQQQQQKKRYEMLSKLNVQELLSAVLKTQEERTMTYKQYDTGLETVLQTMNVDAYPAICANATAQFALQSDLINTAKQCLTDHHQFKRKDLVNLIVQLQQNEREKLNVTAALHLERIRECGSRSEGDRRLLLEGIATLRQKIAGVIDRINETLEELRCALTDEIM